MLIKKAKFKRVRSWERKRISDDLYGCDECKDEIKDFPNESQRLEVKIFHRNHDLAESKHFCSWECVLKHLPKIKCDYFVDLPFMYFDEPDGSKRSAERLIKIIKKLLPKQNYR